MIHNRLLVRHVQHSLRVGLVAASTAVAMGACSDDPENDPRRHGRGGSAGSSSDKDAASAGNAGSSGAGSGGTSGANGDVDAQWTSDARLEAGSDADATTTSQDAGDGGEAWTSLCKDSGGSPLSYDFSRGLAGEYAFELVMNCDLAGYMSALVDADPVNLTRVEAYVGELTDWYRATILRCADGDATAAGASYGLVPSAQSAGMSTADFRGTVNLFISILDRHDGLPDGLSPTDKAEVERRLTSFREQAVKSVSDEFTRPASVPDCIPSPSPDGGVVR